ncbi:MAG: AbrB/MazE/SpoVT family DNA-binding domain-containing protein, partial [Propionibacteriaceae bacterium]|nr:AbrB/MazE/SpoVT family DNA-binding domain-containing protein [Propionibacteriaceae bacterium]
MPTAIMSSKGQLVVPQEVRVDLGLTAGSRVDFVKDGDHYQLVPRKISVKSLYGYLPKPERAYTLGEMQEGIIQGALESMQWSD